MISPVPGGARRRSRAATFGLLAAAGLLTVAAQEATATAAAAPTGGFPVVSAPFTGSSDYVTGFESCDTAGQNIGPMGVLFAAGRLFVTDLCNWTTYSYTPGADNTGHLLKSKQNGLSAGLALDNGVYYGIADTTNLIDNGVWTFDPDTLAVGKKVADIPCNGDPRDLATDPATGDLLLTTKCGLYRITDLDTATPKTVLIGTQHPNLDGIEVVDGGKHAWAANVGVSVDEYDLATGAVLQSVPLAGKPDGLALAGPGAPAGIAGNLFVNSNDGTITMIDVHHGNKASVVASGGTRGDFVTVGPDGLLYATQSAKIVQLAPGFFVQNPTGGHPTSPPTTTPTTHPTTTHPTTTRPTTVAPTTTATGASLPGTGAGLAMPLLLSGLATALLGTLLVLWTRRQRANAGTHE